ncbi:DUF423 domain-containing protein [Neorhodopirellula pilleata]|uniref:DUF423 domain-containing protein n=1 Tax=Neorhodopirellula pilleata TaxID=2714738 RepID=A0A5C6ATY2_9BACT|nr:DUF423 domain-containing protein [Neorhodopirellula pilleata]TWU03493.1 hypothetical protein Pla100_04200 [Neorhodopirellula pilleata]
MSNPLASDSLISPTPTRGYLIAAAIAGATAIIIGAFGAHGLQSYLPETGIDAETLERRLSQFDTGARYHLAHAVVLLVLAASSFTPTRFFRLAFALMIAGIVLFSGSLYLLVLTNTPALGAITPLGGTSWIVAWCLLGFCRRSRPGER